MRGRPPPTKGRVYTRVELWYSAQREFAPAHKAARFAHTPTNFKAPSGLNQLHGPLGPEPSDHTEIP
jgi:hypothetical protein